MMGNRATNNRLVIIGGIVALVVLLLALSFVANLLANITLLLPLAAGVLLLMGNAKTAMSTWRSRQANTSLASAMIGLSLVLYGVAMGPALFKMIFYVPAVMLLVLALPMALGKPGLFQTYGRWISSLTGRVRGRKQMQQPTQQINITQPNQQQQWYDQNRQN